jgi:hypothetical protein
VGYAITAFNFDPFEITHRQISKYDSSRQLVRRRE